MSIEIIKGNIFASKMQTIVNPVNCVGVMGAGIALEFRLRYREMYEKYVQLCSEKKLKVGLLWIYNDQANIEKSILNFPTKNHWKYPSKIEYLELGLRKFCETYKSRQITSIAFPLLGAGRGGLDPIEAENIMTKYLKDLDLTVEIYKYDPKASDDLYDNLKRKLLHLGEKEVCDKIKLGKQYVKKIFSGLNIPGIGDTTIEKVFDFAKQLNDEDLDSNKDRDCNEQLELLP